MPGWIHLELNFENYDSLAKQFSKEALPQKKPEGSYKELITYLKKIVDSVSDLTHRYFFLFQSTPHLFLALEVKDPKDYGLVEKKIKELAQTKQPKFIASDKILFPTTDGEHPEGTLDLFCASAKYAFFRITDGYKPGYYEHDEAKIMHCFCNQVFSGDWNNETIFYLKGLFLRGALPFYGLVNNLEALGCSPKQIIEYLLLDARESDEKLSLLMAFFMKGFPTEHILEYSKPIGLSQEAIIEFLRPKEFPQEKIIEFAKLISH